MTDRGQGKCPRAPIAQLGQSGLLLPPNKLRIDCYRKSDGKRGAAQIPNSRSLAWDGSVVASRSLALMSRVSPPISSIVLSAMPLPDSSVAHRESPQRSSHNLPHDLTGSLLRVLHRPQNPCDHVLAQGLLEPTHTVDENAYGSYVAVLDRVSWSLQ